MESLSAAQDNDNLLPMVDYRTPGNTTSYVTHRDEMTFFSSVTEVSDTRVRVATLNVNNDQFIDLKSLQISFEVHNDDTANSLTFLAPTPHIMWDRMVITIGGITVEGFQYYNRAECLFADVPASRQEEGQRVTGLRLEEWQ